MSEEVVSLHYPNRPFRKRYGPAPDLSHHIVHRQTPKVPRLVSATHCTTLEALLRQQRRWATLRRVREHPGNTVLLFNNVRVVELASAIDRACRHLPSMFSTRDFVFVRNPPTGCFLLSTQDALRDMRAFLVSDLISDPSAIRQFSFAHQLAWWYQNGSDLERYAVCRTLLKWTCRTRSRRKNLALPTQPCFALYRYLHKMVACFSVDEISQYRNTPPSFHHALRSFLQLQLPHFISSSCLVEIQRFLTLNPPLQRVFPQVRDIVQLVTQDGACSFPMDTEGVPGHAFIYGMALHPSVPVTLRKRIFLNVFVQDKLRRPAQCKSFRRCRLKETTLPPFAQFLYHMELRSFLPPQQRHGPLGHGGNPVSLDTAWVVRWPEYTSDTLDHHGLEDRCIEPRYDAYHSN